MTKIDLEIKTQRLKERGISVKEYIESCIQINQSIIKNLNFAFEQSHFIIDFKAVSIDFFNYKEEIKPFYSNLTNSTDKNIKNYINSEIKFRKKEIEKYTKKLNSLINQ